MVELLVLLSSKIQVECDKQASQVVDQFVIKRQFKEKFKSVQNSQTFKGSSANMERYDPRELDVVLREVVVMNARAEMYLKFIEKRIKDDIENIPEEEKTEEIMVIQEKVISNCELSKKMQELIGNYIYMEEYFMRETVMKVSFHGNKYLNTSREEDKRESLLPAMPLFLTRSWMDDYSS